MKWIIFHIKGLARVRRFNWSVIMFVRQYVATTENLSENPDGQCGRHPGRTEPILALRQPRYGLVRALAGLAGFADRPTPLH
jgi:hypothetical protein